MARRKKKNFEEHPNHERWLVSYADFITLLFAFFVVMYAISQVSEGKYRVLSESLVSAFRSAIKNGEVPAYTILAPTPISPPVRVQPPRASAAERRQAERMRGIARDILKALDPLIKDNQVRVTHTKLGLAVEINAAVLFASGDARLQPASESALRSVAAILREDQHAIRVEGHTDDIPISTPGFPSNWELSAARAGSVVRLFEQEGVPGNRLAALGFGPFRPTVANDSAENRGRNRRVTVMILASDPDEGRKEIEEKPGEKETGPETGPADQAIMPRPEEGFGADKPSER